MFRTFRLELPARHVVDIGDLSRLDDPAASTAAVSRVGADDVVARLEFGLATQFGPSWKDGVDLSFGQWQKLALARGFMREHPLPLMLDEPTAARLVSATSCRSPIAAQTAADRH